MNLELQERIRKYFGGARKLVGYLATVNTDAGYVPEVRPISFMECDWCFYLATWTNSRKAKELLRFPKAAALIPLRSDKYSGYLRMIGRVEIIEDTDIRQKVADTSGYPINSHWNGVSDPTLLFARIISERVEFMEPGEDVAKDITAEFLD
jgi:general stress protein 26